MGNVAKRARRKLEARINAWEKNKRKSGYKKPGSLKAHTN